MKCRYIKGLVADPDKGVASAALLSGIQMFNKNEELIKKWTGVLEKITGKDADEYCIYQGLILLG